MTVTLYAKNNDLHIAYRVVGQGPIDIVVVCGTMSHLDLWSSDRRAAAMVEGLASFARVILFDKPGTGLSDPVPGAPTLEQRLDDVVAVMDAAGSERAFLLGYSEGGLPSIALAATQPDRIQGLVLMATSDHLDARPGDPPAVQESYRRLWLHLDNAKANWGNGDFIKACAPTYARRPEFDDIAPGNEMRCMSRGMARSIFESYRNLDVRDLTSHVNVPTLILQADDQLLDLELGRDMATRLPGARFVELEGHDHFVWINNHERIASLIREFTTGQRGMAVTNRVLATIVFTDIVGSTQRAAESDDDWWSSLRTAHDQLTRELVESYGGRAVKSTGDGWLALFNGTGRAIRCSTALVKAVRELGLQMRVGIHAGECDDDGDDVHGISVHIAARVNALARPDEVLVSSTVKDLVAGSGLEFADRGEHELKGAPDRWRLHAVLEDRAAVTAGGYHSDVRALA